MATCDKDVCYEPGSLVWAKIDGFPWWPAMVDRDPVGNDFIWTEEGNEEATHYNVVFLDEKLSRGWVPPKRIIQFNRYKSLDDMGSFVFGGKDYRHDVLLAFRRGKKATKLKASDRVAKFGYQARIKEPDIELRYDSDVSSITSDDMAESVDSSVTCKFTDPTWQKRRRKNNQSRRKESKDHKRTNKTDERPKKRHKSSKEHKRTEEHEKNIIIVEISTSEESEEI